MIAWRNCDCGLCFSLFLRPATNDTACTRPWAVMSSTSVMVCLQRIPYVCKIQTLLLCCHPPVYYHPAVSSCPSIAATYQSLAATHPWSVIATHQSDPVTHSKVSPNQVCCRPPIRSSNPCTAATHPSIAATYPSFSTTHPSIIAIHLSDPLTHSKLPPSREDLLPPSQVLLPFSCQILQPIQSYHLAAKICCHPPKYYCHSAVRSFNPFKATT